MRACAKGGDFFFYLKKKDSKKKYLSQPKSILKNKSLKYKKNEKLTL